MRIKNIHKILILLCISIAILYSNAYAQLTVTNGAKIYLNAGSKLAAKGGISLQSGGEIIHNNSAVSTLFVSGKFNHLGTYSQNGFGILRFFDGYQDTIAGNDLTLERLWIRKSGIGMVNLAYGTDLTISSALRLISNSLLNIDRSNLTIDSLAMIYPDSVSTYSTDPITDNFSDGKHITSRGDSASTGTLIRKLRKYGDIPSDMNIRLPIGTPNNPANPTARYYSPVRYVFNAWETRFGTNAFISTQCVAAEHYATEVKNVALKKYWRIDYDSIIVEPGGYSVRFSYNQNEVQGFEELYLLCLLFRPYDGVSGTYYINAGSGYGVEPINNRFYVDEVNQKDTLAETQLLLDGEWTAGQAEAISTYFYSRKDGNWEDPDTWSKQGYNGVASSSVPSTLNDKAFIGNGRTVTINSPTNEINRTNIENTGRLVIANPSASLLGDSLYVKDGGTLAVSHSNGINASGDDGNIQTTFRNYSTKGIYEFIGTGNQISGAAIPDIVGSVVVNKNAISDTLSLSKSILIKDSLIINQGAYHLFKNGNFTSNGETGDTTGREIKMRGGELIVTSFPTKYKNANFEAGTVTFAGTGSFRIPSSGIPTPGEPAVTQYYNINLKGSRAANTIVTLDPTGEIRIKGLLDISKLSFNPIPLSERFLVTGSKVVFNGTGDQQIQTGYATPTDINYRLKFHKLIIAGTGNKTLANPNDDTPANDFVLVRDTVVLQTGNFVSNGYNLKVLSGWRTVAGATFEAGTGLVNFEAEGKDILVRSNGIQFNDVSVTGSFNGIVNYLDSTTVGGDLSITTANLKDYNNTALSIRGNYTNAGKFLSGTGRVYFNGSDGDQSLINNSTSNSYFYNLTVNKPSGNVKIDGSALVKVNNNLTLTQGNIGGRTSSSVPNKPLVVDGTITRTGASSGHVDGRLRLTTAEGVFSRTFEIGLGDDYAPMTFDVNGAGGAAGYLDAYVLLDTDAPNINTTVIGTQIPNGPELEQTKNVRKVWVLFADTTGTQLFTLASSRSYDIEFGFPTSDIRNGALTGNFEIGQRDTTINYIPGFTGRWTKPFVAQRNANSTKFTGNQLLNNNTTNFFILGEPKVFTYYSIADGNLTDTLTWSTAGYLSTEAALRPPSSNDNIRIGNGKTVTLNNSNHSIGSGRTFVVETGGEGFPNGHLDFDNDTRYLQGQGTFILDSGAAITIRHNEGIYNYNPWSTRNDGCIITRYREYNYNNHNSGHFIYARNGNQFTGNGFPPIVRTLQMNKPSGTLTFTGSAPIIQQVWDSLYLASGTANLSTVIMKVGGNFVIDNGASFTPGTTRPLSGGSIGENNRRDTAQYASVVVFNGNGEQHIRGTFNDSSNPLVFNRLSLSKPSGIVISHFNIRTPIFWLKQPNRASFDVSTYNKYINVYHNNDGGIYGLGRLDLFSSPEVLATISDPIYGAIIGRLIRFINNPENERFFPIGTLTKYAPIVLSRDNGYGSVAGLLEIQSVDGNHPNFNNNNINPNTNIQRYYEITRPVGLTPTYTQGTTPLNLRIYFTQDEPRGGIDPEDYVSFRLISDINWTSTTSITTDDNTSLSLRARPNNNPSLTGNNIFSAPSEFSSANSITLMIGEAGAGTPERIFYSRNSGSWTDPNTWSYSTTLYENTETGYALDENSVNDYPRYSNTSFRDYAIIGAGDSVYCDTTNFYLAYALLEKSASGMGKLVMPGENNFTTEQYVQKNGGKLFIGSTSGINSPATAGNILRRYTSSIINYDWNDLGVNNFAYVGTVNQATGSGLPTTIASLEINNTGNNYVNLSKDANLLITDSLVILNGTFRNRDGDRTVTLLGDFINNSNGNGLHFVDQSNRSNRSFIFEGENISKIRGTADSTVFPSRIIINKTATSVIAEQNIHFNLNVEFQTNTLFSLADNYTVTFGSLSEIDNLETFNSNKMFKVSGGENTGKFRKLFSTGTNTSRSFIFPVGEDSLGLRAARYGEAEFELNTFNFTSSNYLELTLRSLYPHQSLTGTPNMLTKYWHVTTNNIERPDAGRLNLRFKYNDKEVRGNILNYLPAMYRRADISPDDPGWSSTIFAATNLQIDTTNKYVIIDNAQAMPWHDWTAGEPSAFAKGRTYWSIASGNWTNPRSWTNITAEGEHDEDNEVALNYPGFYADDTVFIGENHVITFNDNLVYPIDSIGIGITGTPASPELQFLTASSSNKKLQINGSIVIGNTGLLSKPNSPTVISIDTLDILRDFVNEGAAGRGVNIHLDTNRNIQLVFSGADSTRILGEGNYSSIGNVRIFKSDSIWNTVNHSASFSSKFSNAVLTIPTVDFDLDAGMYVHDVSTDITLSTNGDGDVFLGDLVGLTVRNGNVIFSDGLICGQNASVWLINGNLTIGNTKNENFQYESVTTIDIAGTSKLKVAGSMRRKFATSSVDFRIRDNAQIEVMLNGATTNSSERRAAFDFGEANSHFTMTGNSKVIIYRPMDTSIASEKDPDYLVSTSTSTVTGGTVQFGHPDSSLTVQPFNLIASVPFWNLDLANTYGKDLYVGSPIVTVRNDFTIRTNSIFNQNGNNLNIGGDFFINGKYKTGSSGTRRLSFNGDTSTVPATKRIQTLSISSIGNDNFYDFAVSKADSGLVYLSGTAAYSNLIVTNTLEFSIGNKALIYTGENRYVQVGTGESDLASIQRFGRGHINGYLRRWINNGPQDKTFFVGTQHYTPARVQITSGTGTEGLLSVKAYGIEHPDISNLVAMQPNTHIDRYWQITPNGSTPFALGDGRTYSLTLSFLKGNVPNGDVKAGSSFGIFEHFRRTPIWSDTGSWYSTEPMIRTDSSTTTSNNAQFGDFVIGEIAGDRFFSAADGDWNTLATWRTGSYEGPAATRIPSLETDRVFIGNGKNVTIQYNNPRVRSVTIEVHDYKPGRLTILEEKYLRSLSFSLNDSCFLATDHPYGFASVSGYTPNTGAIRATSVRSYGKGTYEFIGNQSQATGDGPINPKTIIVNNLGTTSNSVSFSPYQFIIEDSLLVQNGNLVMGDGDIYLKGQFVAENGTKVEPAYGTLFINGSNNQNFVMNDTSGISLYNLNLTKTTGNLFLKGNADSNTLKIERNLTFASGNTALINARTYNKKVVLTTDTATITRTGSGYIDGYMQRWITSGRTYNFTVGSIDTSGTQNIFAPVAFEATGSGAAGWVSVQTNVGSQSNGAHKMMGLQPGAKFLRRFWTINDVTTTINGKWNFSYTNADLVNPDDEAGFTRAGRWRPIEEQSPGTWTYPFATLSIDTLNNIFSTDASFSYDEFLGDWVLGNSLSFRRIFFSKQTGNWNDPNTWTFNSTHDGDISGLWPDDELDSVVIGGKDGLKHIVNLNISESNVDGVALGAIHPGALALPGEHSLTGKYFQMFDYSILQIGSSYGINPSDTARGNIKSTQTIALPEMGIYEYIGAENQTIGEALPSNVYRLKINNTGGEDNNIVALTRNIFVRDSLTIDSGVFNLQTNNATGSDTAHFSVLSDARLRITGTNTLLTSLNGYLGYNFDANSYTEFFGAEQIISNFPAMLVRTVGLGNVITSEAGFKRVNDTFKVRGSIWINNASTLYIAGPQLLQVSKNVVNSSIINNNGIIEIGE